MQQPGEEQQRELDEVIDLLMSLGRLIDAQRHKMAEAAGLGVPGYSLLCLAEKNRQAGVTVSEAAEIFGIRPQALSSAVREMAQMGLINRRVDESDGRARRLWITDKGVQRLRQGREIREALAAGIIKQVPQPSVARLILDRMEKALRKSGEREP